MGRKLDAFEEASFMAADADPTNEERATLSYSQHLQQRIADHLGVPVTQLRGPSNLPNAVQVAKNLVQDADMALSSECVDLIEAYMRIIDPVQRRRCLQVVRQAAYGLADAGLATEA
ncbi:hypothetical protein ACLBWX_22425 [Methylobacterium sp. M6A4_1b]